jgi:hypothetical protein
MLIKFNEKCFRSVQGRGARAYRKLLRDSASSSIRCFSASRPRMLSPTICIPTMSCSSSSSARSLATISGVQCLDSREHVASTGSSIELPQRAVFCSVGRNCSNLARPVAQRQDLLLSSAESSSFEARRQLFETLRHEIPRARPRGSSVRNCSLELRTMTGDLLRLGVERALSGGSLQVNNASSECASS